MRANEFAFTRESFGADRWGNLISFGCFSEMEERLLIVMNWINKAIALENSFVGIVPEDDTKWRRNGFEPSQNTTKLCHRLPRRTQIRAKHVFRAFYRGYERGVNFHHGYGTIICFTNWISFLSQYWLFIRKFVMNSWRRRAMGKKGTRNSKVRLRLIRLSTRTDTMTKLNVLRRKAPPRFSRPQKLFLHLNCLMLRLPHILSVNDFPIFCWIIL